MTRTAILLPILLAAGVPDALAQRVPQKLTLPLPEAVHATTDVYGNFFLNSVIVNVLASQLSTFPVGSSAGAFTFIYDAGTRTFVRQSATLGPWFAERATTMGRPGALSIGSATQFARYDRLDGRPLRDAVLYEESSFGDGSANQLDLSLSQQITTLYATVGLSRSVDVSVTVPLVRTTFHAVVQDETGKTLAGTFARSSSIGAHDFAGVTTAIADFGPVSDTGIGDVQVRAKWNAFRSAKIDAAALLELRLPTGDYLSLSGTGAWRQKLAALVTVHGGAFAAHANVGYTFHLSGASLLEAAAGGFTNFVEQQGATTDEFSVTAGSEWAPRSHLSLTVELISRVAHDGIAFRPVTSEVIDPDAAFSTYTRVVPVVAPSHQYVAAVGGKFNLAGSTVVSAHVVWSPGGAGLSLRPTPVIGIEHAF